MGQQTYVQPDLWPNIQQDEQTTRLKDEQRNGQPDNWTNRQMVRQTIGARATGDPNKN